MNVIFTCGGTAGHVNPALALAGYLRERQPSVKILFVGAERGLERDLIAHTDYPFKTVNISSFHRSLRPKELRHNLVSVRNLAHAKREADVILDEFRPDLIVGTGGYASYPVVRYGHARGIPTAVVAASTDLEKAKRVQEIWSGPLFRVYTSTDPVGVEIGGAVKNVLAIAVGCSDGLGFGDNTRAALITRGLVEMKRFVLAYGGKPETLSGLAGIGDLIVTCTSAHSRNHSVGERLGKGEKISDILGSMQMVAEGVWNAKVVHEIAARLRVEMPICEMVHALCYEGFNARDAVSAMMLRDLKSE